MSSAVPSLYGPLASLWPLLSPPDDYIPEADHVRKVLRHFLAMFPASQPDAPATIMELGAGGGHTLHHLTDEFHAVAVDLSDEMLANSRRLNPTVEHIVGDMRTLRLGRTFDAVLLHDAVDYMTTPHDAIAALMTASTHLRPGGVALVAPTYVRESFDDNQMSGDFHSSETMELGYTSHVRFMPGREDQIELNLTLMIREDASLRIERDRHVCGLFTSADWRRWLIDVGLNPADNVPEGEVPWNLFVAVR